MQSVGRLAPGVQQVHSRKRDTHLNNLTSRLRDSLKSIQENYELMLSRAKVNACESITSLVSEIKQLLLLGDFRWLEAAVQEGVEERDRRRADLDAVATRLHEEVGRDLCALEEVLGPARPLPQGYTPQS